MLYIVAALGILAIICVLRPQRRTIYKRNRRIKDIDNIDKATYRHVQYWNIPTAKNSNNAWYLNFTRDSDLF